MRAQRIASALIHRAVLPLTPSHRRLRLLAWSNRAIQGGDPELQALDRIVPAGCRTAVDAGANIGLYTLRLAALAQKVYAFEINPGITGHLESAGLPNVQLIHSGLSDTGGAATLYIPMLGGTFPLYGWASLTRGNCPDTDVETELPVRVRPLDSFQLADVDFIKIDVEGHELQVLQGARETLARYRPRIFAELRHLPEVTQFLSRLGYRAAPAREAGLPGAAPWMYVFDAR